MKKKEIIILALVVAALALVVLLMNFMGGQGARQMIITVDGQEYQRTALSDQTNMHFTVETPNGYNEVIITNGVVGVVSADCDSQVCVETRSASRISDTIVCLPHRMVIEIVGANGETD